MNINKLHFKIFVIYIVRELCLELILLLTVTPENLSAMGKLNSDLIKGCHNNSFHKMYIDASTVQNICIESL